MPLDPLVGTLVRGQPTTPAQANDLARRFVVGQTLKGVVLRALPEGQTLVNFAGQHVVLELPPSLSSGHTLLATVQHITPTLVLKVLGEPGAPGVTSPQAQITPQLLGHLAEAAETLDPVQLKSYLMARQPFGEMVVTLQQHLLHNPMLRSLDAGLLQRLADTVNALLPQDTTLPDASGLQAQVDRSGINYEAKVAEVLTQQATPAEQEALAHDLKGQLLELAARLDQASRQGNDVGESRQQVQQALHNIEFQQLSKMSIASQALAWALHGANARYATDYPASVGPHMTNTDSTPFMDLVPAVSLRENERGNQIGNGWDPHWHQPTDVFATFSDKDFRLGLNAAQTTLGAVAELTGATLRK